MTRKKLNSILLIVTTMALLLVVAGTTFALVSTDKHIEMSALNSHVFKTYLKEDSIHVDSKHGVVTLSGTVTSQSHKSLAEATVENISGVKQVNNLLTLSEVRDAEKSDGWIGTKVKTTLMFHRNVNGMKTQVNVREGLVTLQGEADSQAQKELTTEYAKDIDGVKSVNNEMVILSSIKTNRTMGDKIDDASITAQVKLALLYHRSTSSIKTQVKTHNGVVVLKGKALNSAEITLVTKLVKDINGVRSVQNQMSIEPDKKS